MFLGDVFSTFERHDTGARFFVPADWMQGRTSLGGLLTAFAVHAMREHVGANAVLRSVHTAFMAPAAGELEVTCRVLRRGSSVTFVEAEITANGVAATKVSAVFGSARGSRIHVTAPSRPAPGAIDAFPRLAYLEGVMPAFTQHIEFRWVRGQMPFSGAKLPQTEILFRLVDPEPLDERHVVLLSDAPPTPGISMLASPAPMASVSWSLELFELPSELDARGFFRVEQAVERAENGYLTQTATLYDPAGAPVSRSHQLIAVFA